MDLLKECVDLLVQGAAPEGGLRPAGQEGETVLDGEVPSLEARGGVEWRGLGDLSGAQADGQEASASSKGARPGCALSTTLFLQAARGPRAWIFLGFTTRPCSSHL